jgi:hypothetical protein
VIPVISAFAIIVSLERRAPFKIWNARIRQAECRNLTRSCAKSSSWETAVDLLNRVAGGRYQMSIRRWQLEYC